MPQHNSRGWTPIIVLPSYLAARAGETWTRDERNTVKFLCVSRELQKQYFSIAYYYLRNMHDAEDAKQVFFAEDLDRIITRFNPAAGGFAAYLVQSFRYRVFKLLKDRADDHERRNGHTHLDSLTSSSLAPDLQLQSSEMRAIVRDIVSRLSTDEQGYFQMRYVDGGSCADLARHYGVSTDVMKQRLYKMRRRVRVALRNLFDSESL
jgi:RNA polymerase sigma factor (sigma-70 family)